MKQALLLFSFLIAGSAFAQAPPILWQQVYGGTAAEYMPGMVPTPDGGWIAVGNTQSADGDVTGHHGARDGWAVKLDASGAITWQKAYGGTLDDLFSAVCLTSDGGYVFAGGSASNNGDLSENNGQRDAWVLKVNATGVIQWQETLGGGLDDSFSDVIPTADGGFVVAGYSHTNLGGDPIPHYGGFDGWLAKFSADGDIEWQRIIGHTSDDELWHVRATPDGGYITAGQSWSNGGGLVVAGNHGGSDAWVMKVDATGTSEWQRIIGGTAVEQSFDIILTADGGYLLGGHASSTDGDIPVGQGVHDALLVKLDADGDTQWLQTHGSSMMDGAYSLQQLADGSYLFVGLVSANDGDASGHNGGMDVWLVKTDAGGNLQWQDCMGGTGLDRGTVVHLTTDGGLIIAGGANSANGDVAELLGGGDFWLIKTGPLEVGISEDPGPLVTMAPNPTAGSLRLQVNRPLNNAVVNIMDVQGHWVRTERMNGLAHTMDLSGHATGTYIVHIEEAGIRHSYPLLLAPPE